MATGGDPVYTPETANGARLQALLIDEGTLLVRKVFDNEVKKMNPPNLQDQLQQQRNNLELYLDPSQLEKVYPGGGVANSSEHFDMTLLVLLLGRLCHMKPPKTGWGKAPPAGDKRPIAWIIRLRLFRNENYAHITDTALSNTKFDQLWKELSDILRGLGGDRNRILKRKTQTIDPELAKMYREKFEILHRQDNEVKDLIVAQGVQAATQLSSMAEDIKRQASSESKKTRKDLRNIKGAHGKQHKQIMGKFEEEQTALKTFGQQQNNLIKKVAGLEVGLQPICAEVQKQSADMKELKDKVYDFTQGENPTPDRTMQRVKASAMQIVAGVPCIIPELCEYLRRKYRNELRKIRPLPWCPDYILDLEHVFTTLEMVCTEDLKTIATEDMFQPYDGYVPKTIRVEGDPGIGKSILCHKIVYDCSAKPKESRFEASNKFASFQLALYVDMQRIPHDATDLRSAIFHQVFPDYPEHVEEFCEYVRNHPDNVLFVLDGLDEMPEKNREKLKIEAFLSGRMHVIVTSRPYLCSNQLRCCNRYFVIKGYSQERIKTYINEHPKLEKDSKLVMIQRLESPENESLHQLTANPLNLALLCILWEKDWNTLVLPKTVTGLYSLLVLAIFKRYASNCLGINQFNRAKVVEEMPKPIPGNLNDLNNLAWKGMQELQDDSHLYLEKEVEGLVKIGFLTKDLNEATPIQDDAYMFRFLHKTFEEYFAAKYLQKLCVTAFCGKRRSYLVARFLQGFITPQTSQVADMLKECVENDRYRQVLKFLAGLLGTNAYCLFEALNNNLRMKQNEKIEDEKTVSLCLECLHESGAGIELAKYVSDILPRDWNVGYDIAVRVVGVYEALSHIFHMNSPQANVETTWNNSVSKGCFGMCFLSCNTSSDQIARKYMYRTYCIRSNEALYGLVHLLQYQANTAVGQNNPQLSNVHLRPGLDNATCRFLEAISKSSIKVINFLAINITYWDDLFYDKLIEETCNLLKSEAYRDLLCNLSMYPCNCSSLDNLNKVLSTVPPESELLVSLYSSVDLDESLNTSDKDIFSEVIGKVVKLGSITRDREASVELYIDCAADKYVSGSVSFSMKTLMSTIKQCQGSSPQGNLELLFIVRNLPLEEKSMVQKHLSEISLILQDSCCILSNMTFECSCKDGSVLSTIPLLQSIAVNTSLTEVSLLCDDPDNVAKSLRGLFSNNRNLHKLKIGFLNLVDDEIMKNIFSSYSVVKDLCCETDCHYQKGKREKKNPCQIISFSVLMETGLMSSDEQQTPSYCYQETIKAIRDLCENRKNIDPALQEISFISGHGNTTYVKTGKTEDKVSKVKPSCPGALLIPFVEAIVNTTNPLIVNLPGMTWENVKDLSVTPQQKMKYFESENLKKSNLGKDDMCGPIRSFLVDTMTEVKAIIRAQLRSFEYYDDDINAIMAKLQSFENDCQIKPIIAQLQSLTNDDCDKQLRAYLIDQLLKQLNDL